MGTIRSKDFTEIRFIAATKNGNFLSGEWLYRRVFVSTSL